MKIATTFAVLLLSTWGVNSSDIADPDIAGHAVADAEVAEAKIADTELEVDPIPDGVTEFEPSMDTSTDGTAYIGGGSVSDKSSIPYYVSLRRASGNHACGGSLITPNVVLTAGHCMRNSDNVDTPFYYADFNRFFKDDPTTGYERVPLDPFRYRIHPGFNRFATTPGFDFALVFLPKSMNGITTVQLNSDPNVPRFTGQALHIAGFGITSQGSGLSDVLKELDYKYLTNAECRQTNWGNNQIDDTMLCATGRDGSACSGDSGGPLVLGSSLGGPLGDVPIQVGIMSFGQGGCSNSISFADGYGRISAGIDWIRSTVCAETGEMCFPTGSPTPQSTPGITI